MTRFKIFAVVLFIFLSAQAPKTLWAYWVWSPEFGKFVNSDEEVQTTAEEQYDLAMELYKKQDSKEASKQFRLLLKNFPNAPTAPEALYRLGAIFEEQGDYYRAFRSYRDLSRRYPQSERVNEAIKREFQIGNIFLSGKKAKLLGLEILPSGPRAVEVFKHIVETAPFSEVGDRAQFHLGLAYKKNNQFEPAVEAFRALIDQYPESEFVPQARFQMADTAYLQSAASSRDQRVIDQAAEEIDEFLKHYPGSSISDKAAKLRQEIDEKNAEKNYRIGLFYEDQNYLDSAFIYYRDVAERYPQTLWGEKAGERLEALERPAEFLNAQRAEVEADRQKILKQLEASGSADKEKRKELESELKRTEKNRKQLERSKEGTLKKRRAALKQKEKEIGESLKELQRKKKRFSGNMSEDLEKAFQKWEGSLEKQKSDLAAEKLKIEQWGEDLGVDPGPFYADLIPSFGKAPLSPLEQVQRLESKRFGELAKESKQLLNEKENLYREYEKVLSQEGVLTEKGKSGGREGKSALEAWSKEIDGLEKSLKEKELLYQKQFGASPLKTVLSAPKNLIEASVSLVNPFDGSSQEEWKSKSAEELKALQSHWNEKVAAQQILVDTISQAFNDELARAEEKRILSKVDAAQPAADVSALRRDIKQHEREIRSRYSEIQDRNDRKNELLETLEKVLKGEEKKGGVRRLTAPAEGVYHFSKAFLFGLPERDVELTEKAKQLSTVDGRSAQIQALREEIELESLLIEARNQEIHRLERELEALQAQASFSNVPPFRSLLVKFPYVFVREAITSARRLVPKQKRQERLIEQLQRETAELEQLKKEESDLRQILAGKSGAPAAPPAGPQPSPPAVEEAALKEEIRSLEKQLEIKRQSYETEKERLEARRWEELSEGGGRTRTKKIIELENKLAELIEKERKVHEEESVLLARKKELVEGFLKKRPSDAFTQELNLQKEEIENRLTQLQKRENALGEEIKRVRPQAFPPS